MIDTCRICGSNNVKSIRKVQSPYFQEKYSLFHCNDCLSRFFDLHEHKKVSLESLYEDFVDNNKEKLNVQFTPSSYWKNEVNQIKKHTSKEIQSVLDIGCRTGDFLMHFDDKIEKNGVELSKKYSEVCEQRNITIYSDFVEKIQFPQKYDVVSAYALLEHLEFPNEVLKTMKSLVNKDGSLVILVPWYQCLKEKILHKLGAQWHMFTPPEHLNYFSREFLIDFVTKEGDFELVKTRITSGGLINPFKKIPILKQLFTGFMQIVDKSFINKLAIFDHLFLYFRRK